MNKVTIIIPNFNGEAFLPACIKSLQQQTDPDFDLLIVDNGSKDGSRQWLRQLEENPGPLSLHVLYHKKNLGFAGGVNTGLAAAHTEYVILLNNDTEVFPDYVENLVKAISRSPDIFAVSPLMINAHNKALVDDAGDGYSVAGWGYQIGVGEKVRDFTKGRLVFSACAGGAIYRKALLDQIGYFDERHFAYLEDMDLSYRARLAGHPIVFEPSARVYHLGSATSGSRYNAFKVRLAARNNLYLIYKNMPNWQIALNFFPLLLGTLVKAGFFLKKGFFREYMGGLFEGITTLKQCRRVDFSRVPLRRILALEGELLAGTLEYAFRFIKRHSKD